MTPTLFQQILDALGQVNVRMRETIEQVRRRLRVTVHVLRGRPLMYRMNVSGHIGIGPHGVSDPVLIQECHFRGGEAKPDDMLNFKNTFLDGINRTPPAVTPPRLGTWVSPVVDPS